MASATTRLYKPLGPLSFLPPYWVMYTQHVAVGEFKIDYPRNRSRVRFSHSSGSFSIPFTNASEPLIRSLIDPMCSSISVVSLVPVIYTTNLVLPLLMTLINCGGLVSEYFTKPGVVLPKSEIAFLGLSAALALTEASPVSELAEMSYGMEEVLSDCTANGGFFAPLKGELAV